MKENTLLYLTFKEEIQQDNVGTETWATRLRKTLQKNGQLNKMINIPKTLPGKINKDDYKCKHKFLKKRAKDNFIYEYLAPQSYSDINGHTSCLFLSLTETAKSTLTLKFL